MHPRSTVTRTSTSAKYPFHFGPVEPKVDFPATAIHRNALAQRILSFLIHSMLRHTQLLHLHGKLLLFPRICIWVI